MPRRRGWKRKSSIAFVSAMLGLVALDLHLARGSAPDAGSAPPPSCVTSSTSARYVPFGWNHVVTLSSTCTRDATCTVSTDVAPDPQKVEVPRRSTVDVVTFVASPSQTFTARVACALR